jgi:hypothetical protein
MNARRASKRLPSRSPQEPPAVDRPGASALREYERRHQQRENHARQTLGGLGGLLARVIDEPSSTKVWKQGGEGEGRTASRLAKHLAGTSVRLPHDRRIPRRGSANIDHLAIGPGGITVIDTNTHRGKVQLDRVGGLFVPRRTMLLRRLSVRDVAIDGPKPIAKLANRPGPLAAEATSALAAELARLLPPA